MALAWLLQRWCGEDGDRPDGVIALIVDHGLRLESRDEAALTAQRLGALGIESRILTVTGLALGPRLSERARAARYEVLGAACAEASILDLLLGHHRDDQAETVLMRWRARSGRLGLAGMARIVPSGGLRLVRPLLDVPAVRLRTTLKAAGIRWVDDPSNTDPRFARVRLRDELRMAPKMSTRLLRLAAQAARRRDRLAAVDADRLAHAVTLRPEGFALVRGGDAIAMAVAVRVVGALPYPANTAVAARLAARGGTACGVHVRPAGRLARFDRHWLVVRETASVEPPRDAVPGLLWDGRFRLSGAVPPGLTLAALGAYGAQAKLPRSLRRRWPAALRDTLPALHEGKALVAVPHFGWTTRADLVGCRIVFSPPGPLAASGLFAVPGRSCGGNPE